MVRSIIVTFSKSRQLGQKYVDQLNWMGADRCLLMLIKLQPDDVRAKDLLRVVKEHICPIQEDSLCSTHITYGNILESDMIRCGLQSAVEIQ